MPKVVCAFPGCDVAPIITIEIRNAGQPAGVGAEFDCCPEHVLKNYALAIRQLAMEKPELRPPSPQARPGIFVP